MQIYQTYRNADETEGRGPMVPDLAFLHEKHAEKYIDAQPGVMGRRAKWSQIEYGDWKIKCVNVIDYDIVEEVNSREAIRQAALSKLSKEEKEVLNLLRLE